MKYDGTNLKEVLEAHKRWLFELDGWTEEDCADFQGADLSGAILHKVNLGGANLQGANLSKADLVYADLSNANLTKTNFYDANLFQADLSGANLFRANLIEANLQAANLQGSNLGEANLSNAYLTEADLLGANLDKAILIHANLFQANLSRASCIETNFYKAYLMKAIDVPFIPMTCPDTGSFIAWKNAISDTFGNVIIKLLIPEDAKRSSATGRKCRASKAVVLEIQDIEGKPIKLSSIKAHSWRDPSFFYSVGDTVEPTLPFCEDRFSECESGIHFFMNRQEAVDYMCPILSHFYFGTAHKKHSR